MLTLGRLPVALDLARGFHALGFRVVVAEPLSMHLCRMSKSILSSRTVTAPRDDPERYLADLSQVIDEEGVDLVVPISEESIYVAGLHGRTRSRVFCPPRDTLLRLHDKLRFNQWARELGLPVPAAWSSQEALRTLDPDRSIVIKPRLSCSGRNVRFGTAGTATFDASTQVAQERLDGSETSAFALARNGQVTALAVYRSRVDSGSVAVCFEPVPESGRVADWVERFVKGTQFDGMLAFDFIEDASGRPHAIECNPRATSGLHFLDATAVAASILSDESPATLPAVRPETLTESWSCYTECLRRLLNGGDAGNAFRELRRARDVTWRRGDPWPFLLMMVNTWPIIRRAVAARASFAEVALADVEWRPDGG